MSGGGETWTSVGGLDERFRNRELTWLDFNERVLELADDVSVPPLERLKFLAIFSSNLDEFFQVRVAALRDQVAAGITRPGPDGRTPSQQLVDIAERVGELVERQEAILHERMLPALRIAGIELVAWGELSSTEAKHLVEMFESRIFPVLTPLSVDPAHPFPYISNLSLNLAVVVAEPDSGTTRFARVKVPSILPRFVALPGGQRFVPLEQVIAAQLEALFPGMDIVERVPFRVTRNADLAVEEEEADDLLAAVEMELRRRRFGRAVRLEVDRSVSAATLELLREELDLAPEDVSLHRGPLDLVGLWAVHGLDRPDLKDEPWPPVTQARIAEAIEDGRDMFAVIRSGDLMVHHPYESFSTSVEEFLAQAANDPAVLTIKMTLYRTSGDSPIVLSLIRAAERGVQVAVLIELKARFDEERNIAWAKALERAGVHVVYGLVGLKTHSKTLLVVREEADGIRRYCHVGTGNYNTTTARLYEDLGLFTCDPEIGADLTHLFNFLTGYSREVRYRKLLVAPRWLRHRIQDLIMREAAAGPRGRIIMKLNSLADPAMVELLYMASQAGAQIDLIVRGICCLRPDVPEMSDNIRVRSIVGRNLEHSRVYYFANGAGPGVPTYYIGSADLMPRNLDKRVEVLVPIDTTELQARLHEVLDVCLRDDAYSWWLDGAARWHRLGGANHQAQFRMRELAVGRSRKSDRA